MSGWIKLHRQIQASGIYPSKRRFTQFEAWIDLLLSANWEDSRVVRGYQPIDVKRGQVFTSRVALAQKWAWDRKSVLRFLLSLQRDNMVDIKTSKGRDTGYTLLTILNYEKYQGDESTALDIKSDPALDIKQDTKRDIFGTLRGTYQRRSKKKKEVKNNSGDSSVTALIDYFSDKFLNATGKPYLPTWAKDGKSLKRSLEAGAGAEDIERVMDSYFSDDYYRRNGFDITRFCSAFNSLNSAARGLARDKSTRVTPPEGKYAAYS